MADNTAAAHTLTVNCISNLNRQLGSLTEEACFNDCRMPHELDLYNATYACALKLTSK